MIKVEHTETHKVTIPRFDPNDCSILNVLVTEAKLVLVECKAFESLLWENDGKFGLSPHFTRDIKNKYYKPILISETEKIEVNDWYFCNKGIQKRFQTDYHYGEQYKILALPEHLSPQQLQMIVDGKLKDGDKVLVECESKYKKDCDCFKIDITDGCNDPEHCEIVKQIKLNPHITIYPGEEKMYTREEVKMLIHKYEEAKALGIANKWFEQNVK